MPSITLSNSSSSSSSNSDSGDDSSGEGVKSDSSSPEEEEVNVETSDKEERAKVVGESMDTTDNELKTTGESSEEKLSKEGEKSTELVPSNHQRTEAVGESGAVVKCQCSDVPSSGVYDGIPGGYAAEAHHCQPGE